MMYLLGRWFYSRWLVGARLAEPVPGSTCAAAATAAAVATAAAAATAATAAAAAADADDAAAALVVSHASAG